MGFDITTLRKLSIREYLCERCAGLMRRRDIRGTNTCPVCDCEYIGETPMLEWLSNTGRHRHKIDDPIAHARRLGGLAEQFGYEVEAPLRWLYRLMAVPQKFLHITTRGLDLPLLGALRVVASSGVQVRIIVTSPADSVRQELVDFPDEAPHWLEARVPLGRPWEGPHQKVIVVDGLLAVTGSANFTTNAWRNAREDLEIVHLHTDVDEVVELHNRYFAQQWAALAESENVDTGVPF